MEQSPEIKDLAAALSKAQAEIAGAKKDSDNPFFKSTYADLQSVWEACRKQLTDNGLAIIQTTEPTQDGVCIITTLTHSSGQWIRGKLNLKPQKNDPQGIGSAISYGRRYALAAMVGVYQTDDDGESAMDRKSELNNRPKTTKPISNEYLVPVGNHQGKTLKEVPQLATYIQDLKKHHETNNKPLEGKWLELVTKAEQFLQPDFKNFQ